MKMEKSVPKRRHITFWLRRITQKKAYNIQYTAEVWNQESPTVLHILDHQQLLSVEALYMTDLCLFGGVWGGAGAEVVMQHSP